MMYFTDNGWIDVWTNGRMSGSMKEGWMDKYFTSFEEHVTKIRGGKD